jgi:hypothetical protein
VAMIVIARVRGSIMFDDKCDGISQGRSGMVQGCDGIGQGCRSNMVQHSPTWFADEEEVQRASD